MNEKKFSTPKLCVGDRSLLFLTLGASFRFPVAVSSPWSLFSPFSCRRLSYYGTFLRHCCYRLWKHSLVYGIHSRGRKSRLYPASPVRTTFPPPPPPPDDPPLPRHHQRRPGGTHHFRNLLGHFHSLTPNPGGAIA